MRRRPAPSVRWERSLPRVTAWWRIRANSQTHRDDGCVMAIYPDDGSGDPDAEPGVSPEADIEADALSVTLEVFAIRPDKQGGTAYTWLSGTLATDPTLLQMKARKFRPARSCRSRRAM